MGMDFVNYLKKTATQDDVVGDFAKDVLKDEYLPDTEIEQLEYVKDTGYNIIGVEITDKLLNGFIKD